MGLKVFYGGITLLAVSLVIPTILNIPLVDAGVAVTVIGYILIVFNK